MNETQYKPGELVIVRRVHQSPLREKMSSHLPYHRLRMSKRIDRREPDKAQRKGIEQ